MPDETCAYLLFHPRVHGLIVLRRVRPHHRVRMVTEVRLGLRLFPLDLGSGQHQRVGSVRLKEKADKDRENFSRCICAVVVFCHEKRVFYTSKNRSRGSKRYRDVAV